MTATAAPTRRLRHRKFTQVDVFTDAPFRGNPVAVVLDAEGIDTESMQAIARWTNLSETAFVLPARSAAADYRVRIFTPRAELPFAGHPTIGTAHALLEAGVCTARNGVLVQECEAGLVRLEQDARRPLLWLTMPAATLSALDAPALALLDEALGAPATEPLRVDLGPVWIVARLRDARAVLELTPDLEVLHRLSHASNATGVTVFGEYPASESHLAPRDAARSSVDAHAGASALRGSLVRAGARRRRGSCLRQWQRISGRLPGRARPARGLHRQAGRGRRPRRRHRGALSRRRRDRDRRRCRELHSR